MTENSASSRFLTPIDRVSEILFGLIMVLTSTNTLSVLTAGHADIKTMIIGALGCNLAWGIIDAGMYLMGCLDERAKALLLRRAAHQANAEEARQAIAESLTARMGDAALSAEQLESLRQTLAQQPAAEGGPRLTREDWLGGAGVCVLVFLSTFPVVIPFLFMDDVKTALRVSNLVAIFLLFLCGYFFARATALHPWRSGLLMVVIGAVMVAVTIALGG